MDTLAIMSLMQHGHGHVRGFAMFLLPSDYLIYNLSLDINDVVLGLVRRWHNTSPGEILYTNSILYFKESLEF